MEKDQEKEIAETKILKEVSKGIAREFFDPENQAKEHVLVIRHDQPKQELELRERKHFTATGVIDTVTRYLEKRAHLIDHFNTTVFVDRDKMTIGMQSNETDHWGDKITGSLEVHPDFRKFKINTGVQMSTLAWGDFFRMHRAFFVSAEVNMSLVAILKKFEGKIDTTVAEQQENNGNRKNLRELVVSHNIPAAFQLKIGLFKGLEPKLVEVETKIVVGPSGEILCSLESPEAQEIIERYKNDIFDQEIGLINKLAPNILIIEQ